MKKVLLIIICCVQLFPSIAQVDTASNKKLDIISQKLVVINGSIDSLKKKANAPTDCYNCEEQVTGLPLVIILLPVILFVTAAFYIALRLKREKFSLADALTEKDPQKLTVKNEMYGQPNLATTPTLEVSEYPKSSSRVIAFFSGMAAVIIAVCAVSYYFYMYFRTGTAPDLNKLFDILLILGIGVTPYAVNKATDAIKKQ
jgi:hypothetical protein